VLQVSRRPPIVASSFAEQLLAQAAMLSEHKRRHAWLRNELEGGVASTGAAHRAWQRER
jgi:hypothetical protein